MNREQAWQHVKQNVKNKNLQKHMLATEAVMRRLARYFGEDEEKWGLAGLLHDIDYQKTADDPARHSLVGADMLKDMGLAEEIVEAVKTHNDYHKIPRETNMAKALYAVDPLTGLIVAGALIKPEKKLSAIDAEFLLNRFEEKSFARGANREQIRTCSELGLELEEFLELGLEAMQEIAEDIGL